MKLPEQEKIDKILLASLVLVLVVANYYIGFQHGSVLAKLDCLCHVSQD